MASGDITAKRGTISEKNCAVFDGVNDYVEIPHDASQLGANLSNGFTISAWINPKSIGETSGIILDKSAGTAAQTGFQFRMGIAGNKLVVFRLNNGNPASSAANSINFENWQHVIVTVSSGQLANFYVNGVLSGTANQDAVQTISTITTTNAPRIGNRATATDKTFDGGIAQVKMWNKVLTATEIASDYAGSKTAVGNLILNVPLTNDYTEKAKGLTLTNSGSYLANTLQNRIVGDARQLNLAAATDKIIAVSSQGRAVIKLVSANRAA